MCLCSVEAAEDGQVRSCPAGHSDAGAAGSRQSRPALLLALLHLRCARSRTLRTNRSDRGFHFNKWSESFDERPHRSPRLPLFPGVSGSPVSAQYVVRWSTSSLEMASRSVLSVLAQLACMHTHINRPSDIGNHRPHRCVRCGLMGNKNYIGLLCIFLY